MSIDQEKRHAPSDDDLLAKAIPIDQIELSDEPPTATIKPVAVEPEPTAIDFDNQAELTEHHEIRRFETKKTSVDEHWKQKANVTGQGARHVRTFVTKLRLDAIEHMDEQINQWLDAHPDYEVKFATMSTGILSGKLREEAVFMSVWV